ncbi:MAG: hypothetical protein DRP90_04720 [Planctomycetota bacterium]|nr:MAG: hypothetical protein DRP90_04720 [Planctomycetota bacterium]
MRHVAAAVMLVLLSLVAAGAEYVERVDGVAFIGRVKISGDKVIVEDWDGKEYSFWRDYIRRIRSQETGKFVTYRSKTVFDVYTDAPQEYAEELADDLDCLHAFITKTFSFKRPPKDRITVRVFSSTRDYETHWENRHRRNPEQRMTLAFYDPAYKDVSSVFAGKATFRTVAPRVALVYLMRLYPKLFTEPPFWLARGWFKLFENARVIGKEVDMIGLDADEMETLKDYVSKRGFSLVLLFSFKPGPKTKKSEIKETERLAAALLHYIALNRKYAKAFPAFLDDLQNYAEPMEAFVERMKLKKKVESFQKKLVKWVEGFSDDTPWRIYNRAESYFLRKKSSKCLDLLAEGIKKYPKFEDFRKLRAMVYLWREEADAAMEDIKALEANPANAEMCGYLKALADLRRGEVKRAAEAFRAIAEADPMFFRCYEQLLNIYWEQDEKIVSDEEADRYVKILKENEPFSYTFILEAKVCMKQGRPEDAKVPLAKARRRDPGNPEIAELMKLRRKMAQEKNR